MLSDKTLQVLTCNCCGRQFWLGREDGKELLANARAVGWECDAVDNGAEERVDTCPRCLKSFTLPAPGVTEDMRTMDVESVPRPETGRFREVLATVLREEVTRGVSCGEFIARRVVEGALDGDAPMTRLCFDVMDGVRHTAGGPDAKD